MASSAVVWETIWHSSDVLVDDNGCMAILNGGQSSVSDLLYRIVAD